MSKIRKKSNKNRKEPWEQPIYDTEYQSDSSRTEQHKQKKGTSRFSTILLILIVFIPVAAVATYFWTRSSGAKQPEEEPKTIQTIPTTRVSSSSSSSAEVSTEPATSSSEEISSSIEEADPEPEPEPYSEEPEPEPEESYDSEDYVEPTNTQQATATSSYTVQAGDTLYSIARRNGTTVDALKRLNGMSSDKLARGQVLKIK